MSSGLDRVFFVLGAAALLSGCEYLPWDWLNPEDPYNVTGTIGPEGGTLSLEEVTLVVPAGALASATQLGISELSAMPPLSLQPYTRMFRFTPEGLDFQVPATVTFRFYGDAETAAVFWSDDGAVTFQNLGGVVSGDHISVEIHHFSTGLVANGTDDPPQSCGDSGLTACSGTCVDLTSDPSNCGACGNACVSNCSASLCDGCGPSQSFCGGTCIETGSDPFNCGGCGITCQGSETCTGGQCLVDCGASQTWCGGSCIETESDPFNCGGCGVTCDPDETCSGGRCQPDLEWSRWTAPADSPTSYSVGTDTVADSRTGLVWQRYAPTASSHIGYEDALAYCAGLSLGGFEDWRVPTLIELSSIVDYARQSPAIDTAAFPDTPPEDFWTSTLPPNSLAGMSVSFIYGSTWTGGGSYVRCVR